MLLAAASAGAASLQLDELTWTEVQAGLRAGTTTVIIPIGGTEQNGPHMALGKHNFRAAALSARIAGTLRHALVAPVVAYVPEGRVSPPAGHMRFAGTISVPDDAFVAVVAGAARSLKQHGFLDIVLLGDSGNYQSLLRSVAQRLNREWAGSPSRVHHIAAYYEAATDDFAQALRERGAGAQPGGTHAGLADTSLMMAIDARQVRTDRLQAGDAASPAMGVGGDPGRSSAALGQWGADLVTDKTVAAIRQAIAARKPASNQERR